MPLSQFRKLGRLLGGLATMALLLVCTSQVLQIYAWSSAIHPILGITLGGLTGLALAILLFLPWWIILRLPKALPLPKSEEEMNIYQAKLKKRLADHSEIKKLGLGPDELATEEWLQRALDHLHLQAKEVIQRTAKHTFLVTAVSQNGKLDGLAVLFTQIRMVWQIARVYNQRPSASELLGLYGNIAASTLLAVEVDELDISEQVEPVVNSLLRNTATRTLPVATGATQLVMDSLLEGTINAFFTLRVGSLTMQNCAVSAPVDKKVIRRNSFRDAASMLPKVVMQTSGEVVNAVIKSIRKLGKDTLRTSTQAVTKTAEKVTEGVVEWANRIVGKRPKEKDPIEQERIENRELPE